MQTGTIARNDAEPADPSPPRLVSWNVTARCPLRCAHCYLDAGAPGGGGELGTAAGLRLIDQLAEAGGPVLILSGGEPLLRPDIYDLARYASDRGLRVAMGTGGTLVTDEAARRLADAGVRSVAVSLDSVDPAVHDRFRGVAGAWAAAVSGIDALRRAGLAVQLNTTVGRWNVDRLDEIVAFGIDREIRDFQCFFLVPTGRGRDLDDLSTEEYETAIERLLELGDRSGVHLRPTCAPQFVRIAERMGLGRGPWTRGCLAGISYCRIDPAGTVTPCPYLPLALGNVLERPFGEIWRTSPVLAALRDADALGGRCGRCGYRHACRGCRARAYGAGRPGDGCGLRGVESAGPAGWLGEDRACSYDPATSTTEGMP